MANYLYNGVELPQIPEWDKETYPYVAMTISANVVNALMSTEPLGVDDFDLSDDRVGIKYYINTELNPDTWELAANTNIGYIKPFWANYDVLNEDGTIYLAATEPVPVGGEPIDPTSFMQGWLVGRRLAGMRK